MRTTVNLDEDVLEAVREIARSRRRTLGQVLSDLARSALEPDPDDSTRRNGVPLLPRRDGARPVSLTTVEQLLDEG